MVASSQTWEASLFGKLGSAARDACVLKMAARMPKKQAQTLFQDGESARTVARLGKPEMFADSVSFSGVVSVPFCSRDDLNMLAAQKMPVHAHEIHSGRAESIEPEKETGETVNVSENVSNLIPFPSMKRHETPIERAETNETPNLSETEIRAFFNAKIESGLETLSGLAAKIGVNKGGLHRFLKNNETPSEKMQERFKAFLETFQQGQIRSYVSTKTDAVFPEKFLG
jgi:hypothetical protein